MTRTTAFALLLLCALAACDSGEIADIPYAQVRAAAAGGDKEAFKAYFEGIKGKRIAWQGQVVEARPEVGDDFVRTGRLLVDMDAGAEQPPKADLSFEIPPSQIEALSPGTAVSFVAVIREHRFEQEAMALVLELKEFQ